MTSRSTSAIAILGIALSVACGPAPFVPTTVDSMVYVRALGGFADERGDAVFIGTSGNLVRVRADGQQGSLDPHPGNSTAVGEVRALFPMGPHSALAAAAGGLFRVDQGWVISTGWDAEISSVGVVGAADPGDGTAWVGHQQGLFRVRNGAISELKVAGQSILGITAIAAAPAEDGSPAIWLSTADGLKAVVLEGPDTFVLRTSLLSASDGRNARVLAQLGDSITHRGELWVLSDAGVFRLGTNGWQRVSLGGSPLGIAVAGRLAWVHVGEQLLRYDADTDVWTTTDVPQASWLLAADAAGGAWARVAGQARSVQRDRLPRLIGIDQNSRVELIDVAVRGVFPPGSDPLDLTYQLGNEEVVAQGPGFSLGGEDSSGAVLDYSFLGLPPGLRTLRATAHYEDGTAATRELVFDFQPADTSPISWATDIAPIHADRCSKCHDTGPGHDLTTYTKWKDDAARIAQAISDRRMPADGPLDPAARTKILRWVQGGAAP